LEDSFQENGFYLTSSLDQSKFDHNVEMPITKSLYEIIAMLFHKCGYYLSGNAAINFRKRIDTAKV